ncbi:GNAT family N-acetyltransferase [Paenibacillus polymyxa]|uniref:GNAT family N-acetyltransferase n=1 Tax=Paenibacillus polymyxa TaxID=1406 RepID=UPI0004D7D6E5|nr:GNAT family protein [Paenibacillus polymyxa]KEO76526.1 GCN5 family acetyltransferase [Paenibacillus polymyxa]MCH6190248.1 GNAT family N-acetyltransferase [Paenibacillus polymyxa]MDY8093821.1 GNAT family protein [Paenibacillus polymyxa]WRL60108.1 GNAT family protein [Paenibacillus polymyxa]
MQFETKRLIIRDICTSDWGSIHTYTSLPEVTRHTAWGPNTEKDTKAYIEQVLASQQEKPRQDYELAICLKNTGILIGGVGIHVKDTNAEMGYILNPDYQGKGYATEAARALLGFGFSTLDVHRIYATCRPENKASEKIMQQIGMQREGIMREHWYYKGEFHDSYLYSILSEEYNRT